MHATPSSVLHRAVAHPAQFPVTWKITSIDWVRGEGWEGSQGPGQAGEEAGLVGGVRAIWRLGALWGLGLSVWGLRLRVDGLG
jgi:hypothetical protein